MADPSGRIHPHKKPLPRISIFCKDILPSAFALTLYIQFSLIISFSVVNSRAMGPTSTNHGDGHLRINSVKN
jgi:hypothetical protein